MPITKQPLGKLTIMGYDLLRMALLRLRHPRTALVSLRQNLHPSTEIRLEDGGSLALGSSVMTRKNVSFKVCGGVLQIGTSFFNQGCVVTAMKSIVIGRNCQFGPNVVIVDHDHDFTFADERRGTHYKYGEVVIGDNVWVGANATILRGTHIGPGSVIGAGCVVKGDIPAGTILRPAPNQEAKPIRFRCE